MVLMWYDLSRGHGVTSLYMLAIDLTDVVLSISLTDNITPGPDSKDDQLLTRGRVKSGTDHESCRRGTRRGGPSGCVRVKPSGHNW